MNNWNVVNRGWTPHFKVSLTRNTYEWRTFKRVRLGIEIDWNLTVRMIDLHLLVVVISIGAIVHFDS